MGLFAAFYLVFPVCRTVLGRTFFVYRDSLNHIFPAADFGNEILTLTLFIEKIKREIWYSEKFRPSAISSSLFATSSSDALGQCFLNSKLIVSS